METKSGETCEHGQLKRQCPLCERDEEIAELRGYASKLEAYIEKLRERNKMLEDWVRKLNGGAPVEEDGAKINEYEQAIRRAAKYQERIAKLKESLRQVTSVPERILRGRSSCCTCPKCTGIPDPYTDEEEVI